MSKAINEICANFFEEKHPWLRFICDALRALVVIIAGTAIYGHWQNDASLYSSWASGGQYSGMAMQTAVCLIALAISGVLTNLMKNGRH